MRTPMGRIGTWAVVIVVLSLPLAPAVPAPAPLTLYFQSSTGSGALDTVLGLETMHPTPPTSTAPSFWWSPPAPVTGSNPNTVFDANWRWMPSGGYVLSGATLTATFWAAPIGDGAVQGNEWTVRFFKDTTPLASVVASDTGAVLPTAREFSASVTIPSAVGSTLTVQVVPKTLDAEGVNVILYGSTGFPSRLEIN